MATAHDGEIIEGELVAAERLPQDMLLLKMENESIMAAARIAPRNPMAIVEQLRQLVEAYPAAAEEAIYSRPVGSVSRLACKQCKVEYEVASIDKDTECPACGSQAIKDKHASRKVTKYAEGLSIRAAETIRSVFGYTRLAVTMDRDPDGTAKISGTLVDYAAGNMTSDERVVTPRYKARDGSMRTTPEDRFLNVVVKAEKSKLRRDIILDSVPGIIKALFRDECEKKLVALVAPELIEQKVLPAFAEFGITLDHLEKMIGRPLKMGWKEEDRLQLRKVLQALKSQEMTPQEFLHNIEATEAKATESNGKGAKAGKSDLTEKLDLPETLQADTATTLPDVFALIDQAQSSDDLDSLRTRFVGPDATEGEFSASEWTAIDEALGKRLAEVAKAKKGKGGGTMFDKGSPAPE